MIVLWRMANPQTAGAEFVYGVARMGEALVLLVEGQSGAGAPRGIYDDEHGLTLDGVLRAAEHWRSIFADGGWVVTDCP